MGAELDDGPAAAARDGSVASLLATTFATLDVQSALTKLDTAGAPAAPALRLEDTYTDPFFIENGHYEPFVDAEFGPATGCPRLARFGRTDSGFEGGAPRLGADTAQLLREVEIAEAENSGPA